MAIVEQLKALEKSSVTFTLTRSSLLDKEGNFVSVQMNKIFGFVDKDSTRA